MVQGDETVGAEIGIHALGIDTHRGGCRRTVPVQKIFLRQHGELFCPHELAIGTTVAENLQHLTFVSCQEDAIAPHDGG